MVGERRRTASRPCGVHALREIPERGPPGRVRGAREKASSRSARRNSRSLEATSADTTRRAQSGGASVGPHDDSSFGLSPASCAARSCTRERWRHGRLAAGCRSFAAGCRHPSRRRGASGRALQLEPIERRVHARRSRPCGGCRRRPPRGSRRRWHRPRASGRRGGRVARIHPDKPACLVTLQCSMTKHDDRRLCAGPVGNWSCFRTARVRGC